MTYALETEPGVVVRGPWASLPATASAEGRTQPRAKEPDLTTPAVVAAHPAALMLLLVANRLHARCPVRVISATVFEPASEHGRAAMDELHQQTVRLLSFQSLPREQYAAQVAFNVVVHQLQHGGRQRRVVFCCFSNADRERYAALIDALPG